MLPGSPSVASTALLDSSVAARSRPAVLLKPRLFNLSTTASYKKHGIARKASLSGYYQCLSLDFLLMASGMDTYTRKDTDVRTKAISRNQARAAEGRAPGLKMYPNTFITGALNYK